MPTNSPRTTVESSKRRQENKRRKVEDTHPKHTFGIQQRFPSWTLQPDVDEARVAHDEAAVKTVHGQAIRAAEAMGVAMTQKERATALGLFPKVSNLCTFPS